MVLKWACTYFQVKTLGIFLTIILLILSTVNSINNKVINHTMEQTSQSLIKQNDSTDYQQKYTFYSQRPTNAAQPLSTLLLSDQHLKLHHQNQKYSFIEFKDMIGFNSTLVDKDRNIHKFVINSFPKMPVKCSKKIRRQFVHETLWIDLQQKQLQMFKLTLMRMTTHLKIPSVDKPPHLMIYLNPNAGANSLKHHQKVQQFLYFTNFTHELLQTTHRGHCIEHLNGLDPYKYQGVVIISGDGLMHQFVNSKMCGVIPVTHVPGGSGNGFAKWQTTLADEECRDEQAMFLAVKGNLKELNLAKIQLENEVEPIYSFMSIQWAFLADIDMNSQFLRCCGGLRFQVYAAYRCLSLVRYPGKLTFSLQSSSLPPLSQEIQHPSFKVVESTFLNTTFHFMPYISDKYCWAPLLKLEDQAIDMQYLTNQHGRWQLIKYLLSSDSGDHFDKEKESQKQGFRFQHEKIKSFRLQPLGQGQNKGLFGIDGENYPAQKLQASMADRKILTFA